MENNSDIKPAIEITTSVNDSFYAVHTVKCVKEKITNTNFIITTPIKWDIIKLKFSINGYLDTSICNIIRDSVKNEIVVHVNLNEILFKKGWNYKSYILDKDTIVQKQFYSEVMYW